MLTELKELREKWERDEDLFASECDAGSPYHLGRVDAAAVIIADLTALISKLEADNG